MLIYYMLHQERQLSNSMVSSKGVETKLGSSKKNYK